MLEELKKQTKMITISTTTNHFLQIETCINSIERLHELVVITTDKIVNNTDKIITVKDDSIIPTLDWNDSEPPYLFPILPLSERNLLAFVFFKLGNHQKAFEFISEEDQLHQHLLIVINLLYGYTITKEQLQFLENTSIHNLAIIYNFGNTNPVIDNNIIKTTYEEAITTAKTNSLKFFSTKHHVNFLFDNGLFADAELLIRSVQHIRTSKEEKNAMCHLLASVLMAQVKLPYDTEIFLEIEDLQEQCISYYNSINSRIKAGLLLLEASELANFQEDFIKSKDFINKAILNFKEENIPEFLGEATLQKALLLYNWSKNGSPQYYKPAINTFQNGLKFFKQDTHPQKFADIHHNLALIYSEIQVAEKEKPIWTAFCASSFKEALHFYTKEQFPYEFAMISHNYATALMGFPEAKLHNNLDKAFDLFEEALLVRTAQNYPFERTLTLLNQLELYWSIHNETNEDEVKRFEEMFEKANEINQLVTDKTLIEKAEEHLTELKKLKTIIN